MTRRPGGYATITDPEAPLVEFDTVSCCHCGGAIFVKPNTLSTTFLLADPVTGLWREEPGAWCGCCWKPVCLACHAVGTCTPLEKSLQQMERQGALVLR